MPSSKERWAWGLAAAAAAVGLAAYLLRDSLFPIFLGFGLAYAFDPLADWLEGRGLSRTASVVLIMSGVALSAVLVVGLILPVVLSDASDFISRFPDYLAALLARADRLAIGLGLSLPQGKEEALARLRAALPAISLGTLSPVGHFATRLFSGAAGFLVGMLNLFVVPVVFFYFLRDISRIRWWCLRQVPRRLRPAVERRLGEVDQVFSGYLRGQMSVALTLAFLYAVGLSMLGITFGGFIGILGGLLNIVPYVGVCTGLALSLTMALVDFSGWGQVAGVLILFVAVQALEGLFITPKVVGDKVGLTPVETIIALIVGGELAGLTGMVLAIPTAGCAKAFALDAMAAFRRSEAYRS